MFWGSPACCAFYYGGPDLDDSADFIINGIWSRTPGIGDFDDDGALDIALSVSPNGGFVNIYRADSLRDTIPEYVIADTSTDFGKQLASGDFNGDNFHDLVVSAYGNRDSCFIKFYWGGPDFDTVADFEIARFSDRLFGKILLPLGDFNGDGYEDIMISGGSNNPYGVYYGGPSIDTTIDLVINYGHYPPAAAALAGDINNDGYPDIIWSYDAASWDLRILLGGPDADGQNDVYLETLMIPGGQADLGKTVSGIGDFNGDGIDDVAVYSRTQSGCCWISEVNFFAGWDSQATDVADTVECLLPSHPFLYQNYPNPFNLSTTIEFELPHASHVALEVYNVLGQKVVTLLDSKLPVGTHRITWDGTGEDNRPVASGVYLYRLRAEDFLQTRKMVLVK
jgi:hypothetical protein